MKLTLYMSPLLTFMFVFLPGLHLSFNNEENFGTQRNVGAYRIERDRDTIVIVDSHFEESVSLPEAHCTLRRQWRRRRRALP